MQPGEGGGQQARHLHVLLLVSLQTPEGPAWPAPVWGLWLGSGEERHLQQSGDLVLWKQTSQGLYTGQSSVLTDIVLETLKHCLVIGNTIAITDLLC